MKEMKRRQSSHRGSYLFCTMVMTFLCFAVTVQMTTALVAAAAAAAPPSISMPVWSLASLHNNNNNDDVTSMNIVTFCTPVATEPKLWAVSLYTNTMTRDAFLDSKLGVLQLLTPTMKNLVPLLGKRSGREIGYSKRDACQELGYSWIRGGRLNNDDTADNHLLLSDEESLLHLLPDCVSYIKLKVRSTVDAGDHEVAMCEVLDTGIWDNTNGVVSSTDAALRPPLDETSVLYTGLLRQEGIL